MRALPSPRHTSKDSGTDAAIARLDVRAHARASWLRRGVARLGTLATACLLAGFVPLAARAGVIQGSVFEDASYSGGAGRNLANAAGVKQPGVRVELYTSAGVFINGNNTDAVGDFKFNGVSAGNYWMRVVTHTMKSSRTGYSAGVTLATSTFRTDFSSGTGVDVTNEVGGHVPNQEDAPAASGGATINLSTFQFTAGPVGYANTLAPIHLATGATQLFNVDFGLCFDVIVNANPFGTGSFDQFVINANALSNVGLTQGSLSSGIEHAIWMISNGTNAPGLRSSNNYFTLGVAHIASDAPTAVLSDPVDINAQLQPGFAGSPIVQLDGSGAGAGVNGLQLAASGSSLRGMIIDGYGGVGVTVSATNCVVAGNWIGLNGGGSGALANTGAGLSVAADNATIGGTTAVDRNVVSGNQGGGIVVAFTATGGTVQGNWIGTNATGTGAVPNGGNAGLEVNGTNATIGGGAAGAGNVVSGNVGDGVRLSGTGSHFAGNLVGTDPSGAFSMANSGRGLFVSPDFGGSSLVVGGLAAGEGNTFAFNGGAGVVLDPLTGEGNLLLENAIHDNGGIGIDLGGDGVTANDPGDADAGPNSRQNFPVLTFARTTETQLHVKGTLNSDPGTSFRVELFASSAADPTGNGEGARYVGTTHLTSDGSGNASFDTTITVPVTIGDYITATATSLDFNNTSEFSAAFQSIDGNGIVVSPTAGLVTSEAGDSAQFTVVLESQPTGNVTIPLVSSKPAEGQPSPALLTFTGANWSTPQTVTVHGINDFRVDGNQAYFIQTQPAISTDAHYSGRDAADVNLVNNDDDVAGINVSPTAGLVTTEAGGTATFTVVLNSQPTQDVTIPLSSTNTAEGTVSPASLTFTAANWNTPRTVTLTGVDDFVVDGNQAYSIVTAAASSTDPNYTGRNAADVSATNNDDDVVGVTITPTAGLVTTEAGGTATFTAVLSSQPSGDVSFGLSSTNTAEGTVSPASLTFTPVNWNVAQTVTITGVDDAVIDGNQPFSIVTAAATSTDPLYSGFDPANVAVTNADNDAAAIVASPGAGLVTTEAGGTATFTLVLTSQPTGNVTVPVSSSNTAEGTIAPASVTFTPVNWSVPQTVTLTGVDDAVDDGNVAYSAVLGAATSSDPNYSGLDAADISVTNQDNDAAGITVAPTAGLVTTEAGGTATFTVVLTSQPLDPVTIPISSSNTSEGTALPPSLTFTPANWNVPRTVTVTGVDDNVQDGDIAYSVRTIAASSLDANYNGRNAADVSVTNDDDDVAGVSVTPTAGLVTTEAGGTATFTVKLTSQPLADVSIPVVSSDPGEGTVAPASLTFTPANWNVAQTVTVTGADDQVQDGNIAYTIHLLAASSTDPLYSGFNAADVAATNNDNDVAGITVTPTAGLVTTEAGGTATFTVKLASQPTADVTIPLLSTNTAEGTVAPASVTFTAGNWNVAQTVTVTGVDDQVQDGNIAYSVQTQAATSSDPVYSGMNGPDAAVTNNDNDVAGITVTPTAGLLTSETGGNATFTVRLASQPVADVTIPLSSSNTAEGTVVPASLTFTAGDWNVPQTVTVTGVDDNVQDGDIAYSVVTAAATSGDPNYSGRNAADVSVTNTDNDVAGIAVAPTAGLVTTEGGGTATFTVYLTSQPVANVTIPLSSSNTAEGTVAPASLTFTAGDWNVPQTVTITGVDDAVADGDIAYTILTAAATSADPNYTGRDAADVGVTNSDNDATGITVSPTAGLVTTEAGGTATFTIKLNSQPTSDVTIPLASSNTAEGTVAPASLTFTPVNWSVPQTVTVTGVDDQVQDGNVTYAINTGAAVSADVGYSGQNATDVTVTNNDNDVAGITVSPVAGLVTTEAGGTATFTVVLTSQPVAGVSVPVSSGNVAEGTVSPTSLAFTPANWNVAQTVTVTGVDDNVQDGNIAYTVVTGAASSTDPNYSGRNPADVAVTNNDNDVAGINVSPTAGLVTTEAGGTATFTVQLNSQPVANVTIPLSSSNTAEGDVFPTSLTFTPGNWNLPRTVTLRGTDDFVQDGNIAYTILTGAATSTDPHYSGMDAADVSATNDDDDVAGITVAPTAGLVTSEAGGTGTFTVRLTSQPVANVTIPLSSTNTAEGTVAPANLVFTAANWNVAQTVTVTGVDDQVQDGSIAYSIVTGAATSTDPHYSGMNPADVSATNTDNDIAGVTVAPTAGLETGEWGSTATFTVVLNTKPVANVTIPVTSSDLTEGTVAPGSLTFTPANWNLAQTVTVTGVDDPVKDGDITYNIVTGAATSTDANYSGMNPSDVGVTNLDDDVAGVTVTPVAGLITTEAGGTATFTVKLNSQPVANVTIPLSSSNPAEGTVAPASLVFTAANWSVPQTVTLTGVDDQVQDGNVAYSIVTGFCVSTDPNYSGLDPANVAATNTDNDVAGITVNPVAGLTTTEAGGTATFTVRLTSQPVANVTIPLSSSNTAEGTVAPASLVFTAANWNVAQTVTATGVDDQVKDGDIAYTIVTAAASSADPNYGGFNAADVSVTNQDNDVAGIVVAPVAGLFTTEAGGTATFTVRLASQPTANVTVPLSSSNSAEGTVAPASVTFTPANWNVAQTVTITGVDDNVADGDIAYTVVTGAASSTDPVYSGMNPADVSVTNRDNDSAAITVAPVAGLVTTEAGGTATFTVVLTSQPTANVTIPLSSGNPAEGSVAPASLTFTAANWNVAQTVTVTGVDDNVVDGNIAYTVVTGAAVSADARYNGQDPPNVSATNTDNDTPGILATPAAGLVTTEQGGSATFGITLRSQPVADVVIALSSSDLTEGTVSPASVTITPATWNTPHVVTVTGVDDPIVDGNIAYTVDLAAATSTDPVYAGMVGPAVSCTNDDDQDGTSVTLELTPDHDKIQQGQPVGFRLAVRNRTGQAIDNITLTHVLPARFAALKGTLLQDGHLLADQAGASQSLTIPQLGAFVDRNGDGVAGPGESGYAEFRWQLVPGSGASPGAYTDLVSAVSGCATCTVAQTVTATVHVEENELFSRSTLLGRVFEDRDRNGLQAANEPGVPGAHVVMDDGTSVTTDAQGMFHVPDLESGPRVVKVDVAGLGNAAVPTTDATQVVNVTPGLLASVRFGVAFPRDTVSVGRAGAGGLAVTANEPEVILDLAGSLQKGSLSMNGIDVPVSPTSRTEPATDGVHKAAVRLGTLNVPVDKAGRFATSVPNPGSDTLEVAMVDARGKVSAAHVHLPRLELLSPRGEVRLPFGQSTKDVKVAAAGMPNSQVASADDAAGNGPVAWTAVRGRTDPGAALEVNGRKTDVAKDGGFNMEVPLHVGDNTISIEAKDARGLSNLAHVSVQVADHEPDGKAVVAVDQSPELTLYLPPKGVALQSPALTLAGRTRAGNRIAVNGDSVQVNSDGTFSHRMMLAEGANHLKVAVVDAQGHASNLERDLEVRSPKMFLVALADGVVGRSSGAAFLAPGQNTSSTWNEGRLAWNLRGWVAGRYLVQSAFDSRRRDFQSLFKNLDDAGRDRLLTNLDPDKLYPVFGDSSSVQNSTLAGGRLYVGVQGDAVRASLGNFPIALNDVELAGFHRTLYGAQMQFGKSARDIAALPSGTALSLFGAQASHVHVHDELDATGGTLYYLSHNDVLEGSAQVSLVVRDRVTGLMLASIPQKPGIDVVVKELDGRIQFTRPIASVWDDGSVIGSGRLQGHPVTIEVDYETVGHGSEKTAAGGRITQQVGNKLTLGGTVVDDQTGNGDYRLRGSDFTLNVAKGTRLLGEIATSSGTTGRAFRSLDGGLGWAEADSANERSGMAWKTAAEIDLGEWLHQPGVATITGYVRRVDSGFLSDGERDGIALDREGVRGQMTAGKMGLFSARFDRETRPEATFNTLAQTDLFGMQWRKDGVKTGAAAEFEQRNLTRELTDQQRNSTGALRLWWKPVDKVKTTLEHQQSFDGDPTTTSALALEWRALKSLNLEARGSTGDQGKTIRGGATMSVGARQFYVREEQTLADRGVTGGTMFGMQAPLGPQSRVYSEYQWQRDPLGDHGVSVTGIEQGWHNASGLAMQIAGEHGTRGGAEGQHGTIAGSLSYKGKSPVSGSTRAEARRMMGGTYSRQMLSASRLELALPSGFTAMTDLRVSMSRQRGANDALYSTPNRYTESSFGLSWRAPRSDAVQALGRWTRLADRRGPQPGDSLGTQSVLGVAALEATVRVLPGVEWAMKGATRLDQSGSSGLPVGTAHSSLWASRLDYKLGQEPLRLGVEYRRLSQREAADSRGGWLNELSFDPGQHMRFGVGYNFSRFSGDPLVRNQDSSQGWFIRAQSRY